MSRIYFNGQRHTSEVLGSERAYMGGLCTDVAMVAVSRRYLGGEPHPFARVMAPDAAGWTPKDDGQVRLLLSGSEGDLLFGGQRRDVFSTVLNTVVATRSPALCLLARLHGACEIHTWVAEEHRDWLAGVIEQGRDDNIFRPGQGWESVVEHLRNGDGGPVVTSYSVCDSFPSAPREWMDAAWPAEQVGTYDYSALNDEQREANDARAEAWYDLDEDEQWRLGMESLKREPSLQITPENLTTQGFMSGASLWDAAASPEWSA